MIAFHEAGHFLAAKSQNIKISSYNIGYGPKLFSVNDSSNIEYALRAIPFGGYVSFPTNVEFDEQGEVIRELDGTPSLLLTHLLTHPPTHSIAHTRSRFIAE